MIAHERSVKGVRTSKNHEVEDSDDAHSELSEPELSDKAESVDTRESEGSASEDDKASVKGNPGWADVMQKILKTNKPKKKKTIVLSKAKKLTEVKPKETEEVPVPFEIAADNGEVKRETLPRKVEKDKSDGETLSSKKKRKDVQLGIRIKPSIRDRERERMLQKIATKGVVQLFNVVKQQQVDIDKRMIEVGPLERKREQVLKSIDKRAFLDVLMGGSKSIPVDDATKCTDERIDDNKQSDKVWSVLRDDFVMGAKLKDWDKKAPEDDDDSTSSEDMDSD